MSRIDQAALFFGISLFCTATGLGSLILYQGMLSFFLGFGSIFAGAVNGFLFVREALLAIQPAQAMTDRVTSNEGTAP